jgi:hypothetical protein
MNSVYPSAGDSHDFSSDDAVRAGAVFHHEGLAQPLGEVLREGARKRVAETARGVLVDELDGTIRVPGGTVLRCQARRE